MLTTGILKYRTYQDKRRNSKTSGKWYGKAVQDRTLDFEEFVSHMAQHHSPYSRGVIHGVLMDMLGCLQELVLDGKSVRLGELGLVSLGMKTRPADKQELFTAQNIVGVHLNVRNTKRWANASLRKMCRMEELTSYLGAVKVKGDRVDVQGSGSSPAGGGDPVPGVDPAKPKPGGGEGGSAFQ